MMTADALRGYEGQSRGRGKGKDAPIARHRWMPNARERARVRAVRDAFDRLHDLLPQDPAETQLRQIDILCRSMEYIRELERSRAQIHGDVKPPALTVTTGSKQFATTPNHSDGGLSSPDRAFSDGESDGSSSVSSGVPRRRVLPHRIAINAHMRKRSREMRRAFDALRQVVPVHPGEPHLDKANILRRAAQYVSFLDKLLQEQPTTINSTLFEQSCSLQDNEIKPAKWTPGNDVSFHPWTPSPLHPDGDWNGLLLPRVHHFNPTVSATASPVISPPAVTGHEIPFQRSSSLPARLDDFFPVQTDIDIYPAHASTPVFPSSFTVPHFALSQPA